MRSAGSFWKATFGSSRRPSKDEWFLSSAERVTPTTPIKKHETYANTGDDDSTATEESTIQCQVVPEYGPDDFNPWQFMQALPPYQNVQHNCPGGEFLLPPKRSSAPPITLVLDLDETLVHSSPQYVEDANLVFPVTSTKGNVFQVYVKFRPYLFTFLEYCRGKFEVVLFTASQACYGDELLNRIDPEGKYFQHRLFRESCVPVGEKYLKDLNILGRDLSQTILVDNSPHVFGYQLDNGIPIESWYDDPTDRELLKLERFLDLYCLDSDDIRPALRFQFDCQKIVDNAVPSIELCQNLAADARERQEQRDAPEEEDEEEEGEPGEVHC